MAPANPQLIGEGTYGCVSRPSLTCENSPSMDYTNKVSKLMTKRHAQKELAVYNTALNIPGIETYLIPKPHICKPNDNSAFREFFSQCENKKLRDSELRLLILEDGGVALEDVFALLPNMSVVDFTLFVCSWGKIIDAACFLATHKIMHHDLKLGNIVYNVQTGSLKFIDFGKVKPMSEFVSISSKNQNLEGTSWFNYPVETKCTNKEDFLQKKDCSVFRHGMDYDAFIMKAAETFDMFSIGLVFKELVELMEKFHDFDNKLFADGGIPIAFFKECYVLGEQMSNPDLKHRAFSPCEFQESFAKLCARHKLRCTAPNKLSASLVRHLEDVEHVVDIDNFADKCKLKKKTLNPYTNKCVKKCGKGFVRKKMPKSQTRKNGLFKCVKKRT
jgi:serine/threonine protein kinase